MKTIIYKAIILLSALLAMSGCKSDDMEYHDPNVSPVDQLYAPVDNKVVELSSQKDAKLLFQWSQSHSQDGQLVSYEVVFFKESDKNNPIYRIPSDNLGRELFANISHLDINKACSAAGILPGETGSIYWSVVSWRGMSSAICPQRNLLTATRLEGFENVPENVYITGNATEKGSDASQAMLMKSLGDGEFEIYTKLKKDEPFFFIDRVSGTPEAYYINTSKNELTKVDNNETTSVSSEGVYRVSINFNTRAASITRITAMAIYQIWTKSLIIEFNYTELGVWEGSTNDFGAGVDNKDDRYKIRMTTENGYEWWGPVNEGEDGRPSGNASYYNMALYDSSDEWNPKWKFAGDCWGKKANAKIILSGDAVYTHSIEYY